LRINHTTTVTLPLVLGDVTQAGRLNLEISLEYSDWQGGSYAGRQSVGLEVNTALADRPQLIIGAAETTPGVLSPGDTFGLMLAIDNVGGGDAERVTLMLGGEGGTGLGPFGLRRSGNVRFVAHVAAGESVEVEQVLVVDGSAEPGAYSLPILMSYDDTRGTRRTEDQRISLLVQRQPHLQIGFYRDVELATVEVPFDLPVEVINIGRSLINVSTLEITSEEMEIGEGSIYLGPLDGGTSGSLDATAIAHEGGTNEVLVTVHYLDDFEQPQVVTAALAVQVEQPEEEIAAGEPAAGEPEEAKTFWQKVWRVLRGMLGLGS
jgi:hypothetical protein